MSVELDAYLARLNRSLRGTGLSWWSRRRVVAEAREHLGQASDALHRRGRDRRSAEREAVRRFGGVPEIAAAWRRSTPDAVPALWVRAWVAAATTGVVGGVLLLAGPGRWVAPWLGMMLLLPLAGVTLGVCLGGAQALLLGRRIRSGVAWTLATGAAVGAGLTGSTILVEAGSFARDRPLDQAVALLIVGVLTGATIGLFQQRFLRRVDMRRAGAWIAHNAFGAGSGLVAGGLLAIVSLGGFRSGPGLCLMAACAAATLALWTATSLWRSPAG